MDKKKKKEPEEVIVLPEFNDDMVYMNDIMDSYGYNLNQWSEQIGFGVSYLRDITNGLRPINEELRKAIKEFLKFHKR